MVRLTKEHRKNQILREAIELARTQGLYTREFNYQQIAARCGCARPTVKLYYPSIHALRGEIVEVAKNENIEVIVKQAEAMHAVGGNNGTSQL